jgi:hypothetical protein
MVASCEPLRTGPKGQIVAVVFGGKYLPGSQGNEFARQMVDYLRSIVADTQPAAVVIDLTHLDYIWGDAICSLALPLAEAGKRFRPSAIVARGRTARSLRPLMEPPWLLGAAGMKLFDNREDAGAHLEDLLSRPSVTNEPEIGI